MDLPNVDQSRCTGVHDIHHFTKGASCHLFLNEQESDLSIRVEWEEKSWHFPAHRLVLTSMSEVFRTIFETADMAEKKYCEMKIGDSSPVTVKQFLKYLYMGKLDSNGWKEAVDLMKLAHKYAVTTLVALCESYLSTRITVSNACCLYEIAQTYSLVNLEKHASNWILSAAFIVTTTDGFLTMKSRYLKFFLKSNSLNVENECCVLTTLREWAIANCSRRCVPLTRVNVLEAMKPFMKYIHWDLIPEQLRTFVPNYMVVRHRNRTRRQRKAFHIPDPVQNYAHCLRFFVDLGSSYEHISDTDGLNFLKFCVDNHAFVAGFRIIGMFKYDAVQNAELLSLMLSRDDNVYSVFNLNSLPWTKGAAVGDYDWQETTVYLPYPVRLDPLRTYRMTLQYESAQNSTTIWPFTRLESGVINSSVGIINFHCYSYCYGITRLFILPAPPLRNVCNDF